MESCVFIIIKEAKPKLEVSNEDAKWKKQAEITSTRARRQSDITEWQVLIGVCRRTCLKKKEGTSR